MNFPRVLTSIDQAHYRGNFTKDAVFTHPEAIISLGKYGMLDRRYSYLEPACGVGNLSMVLQRNGYQTHSSDILDWGYGEVVDVFSYENNSYDIVITNPPYSLWEFFLRKCLEIAREEVFLLFPLRYLEGQHRSRVFKTLGLTQVLVLTYRLKTYKSTGEQLSGLTAYAWYRWVKGYQGQPEIHWLYR